MSDNSPLGDLREQMEGAETETGTESETDSTDVEEVSEAEDSQPDAERTPGFGFSETKQSPLYPRRVTWRQYDDMCFEVESRLRKEGLRNIETREIDDALLRFAARNPQEVAKLVEKERRENHD
jgi:hypothetical protein